MKTALVVTALLSICAVVVVCSSQSARERPHRKRWEGRYEQPWERDYAS
jgi:hypothetical protein